MNIALKTFLQYLIIYGLQNNLVICSGSGALIFQREKVYGKYRFLSTLFLAVGIILAGIASYVLSRLSITLEGIDTKKFIATVSIVIVGAYNLLVSSIFRKSKKFDNYLYENSFSYAYDMVFTLSVVFSLETTLPIFLFTVSLLAAIIVVIVSNLLIGFFVKSLNREHIHESLRNVSVRLFLFAILAVLFYYFGQISVESVL